MDAPTNTYIPKYHPQAEKLVRQAIVTAASLLVLSALTIGTIWLSSPPSPTVLGTQTP